MTWRSTQADRDAISNQARRVWVSQDWWQPVYDMGEMITATPEFADWVPSAQTTTSECSFTYTVLNAWALAMGLDPDPTFTPNAHGNEAFFIRVQQIFDLALDDALTWKMLLSFFRCTGFVKPSEETAWEKEGDEANLPDRHRRFDLQKRAFATLVADQTTADAGARGKKIVMDPLPLGPENAPHNQAFASDSLTVAERDGLAPLVRNGQWNWGGTAQQLRDRLNARSDPKPVKGKVTDDLISNVLRSPKLSPRKIRSRILPRLSMNSTHVVIFALS
jgi:hypothetical protein